MGGAARKGAVEQNEKKNSSVLQEGGPQRGGVWLARARNGGSFSWP